MRECTASQYKVLLKQVAKMGCPIPILLLGPPGIGKSYATEEVANELDFEYIMWSLGRAEPYDIKGVPNVEGQWTEWKLPKIYDRIKQSKKRVLLHLDEATLMSPDTQGAILDLVLQKKIDDFKLPQNLIIVLSGNLGDEDGTFARPLTSAITGGRALVCAMVPPSVDEWIKYETDANGGVNKDIVDYLSNNSHSLYEKPLRERPHEPWSNPRSWSRFNEWCKHTGISVKKNLEEFMSDAELLLSQITIAEIRDYFEKSALDVEGLIASNTAAWEKFAKSKDFRQIATIRRIVKEIFEKGEKDTVDEKMRKSQQLIDKMTSVKAKDQVVSEYISGASKFYVGPVFEKLTYKGQKVGQFFDELVNAMDAI
jgi:hypothetical protein